MAMYIKDKMKVSISGNADSASKLYTARTITVGNKSNNFDGSANVSWTLAEIGAAASSHNHGLLHDSHAVEITNTTTDSGWSMFNSTYNGYLLKSVRFGASSPNWGVGNYGSGIVFGGADTKGVMSVAYSSPSIKIAGGNGTAPVWWVGLTGTSAKTYNLDGFAASSHGTHVPTPQTASNTKFLRNDNTWQDVTPANIGAATSGQLTTTNTNIGTLSNLKTSAKDSLVSAVNELFQSANNGKQLIADAIGTPLSSSDTFSAMNNSINNLLSTFKTNMMKNGVAVTSEDKFKTLIDKIAALSDSDGKGTQYAEGTLSYKWDPINDYGDTYRTTVNTNLGFVPTLIFVKCSIYDDKNNYYVDNGWVSNLNVLQSNNRYTNGNITKLSIKDITAKSFILEHYSGVYTGVTCSKWYAVGVGEEDTTLRDSLASILQKEGVTITDGDDMASLITKADEEFSKQYKIVPGTTITFKTLQYTNTVKSAAWVEFYNYTMYQMPEGTYTIKATWKYSTASCKATIKISVLSGSTVLSTNTSSSQTDSGNVSLDAELKNGYIVKVEIMGNSTFSTSLSGTLTLTGKLE